MSSVTSPGKLIPNPNLPHNMHLVDFVSSNTSLRLRITSGLSSVLLDEDVTNPKYWKARRVCSGRFETVSHECDVIHPFDPELAEGFASTFQAPNFHISLPR